MRRKPQKDQENANFITLLNFIADPAVIVDENGLFLAVNNAFENVIGLSGKNLIHTPFSKVKNLSVESRKLLLENLKKRMRGAGPEPYEITFSDTNGEKRFSEVKAKKITYAGHPADLVLFHDVTRRKRNESRLKEYSERMEALVNEKVKEIKESEAKYRELINGMNDTAWVIDSDAKFVDVNDAAVRVLGYSRKELLSMGPADIDSSLTVEQIRDLVKRMPADQIQVFETAHTTKDGKIIPVEISSSLVTYQGKQAVLSIARDITERKKSDEALKEGEEKFRKLSEESPNMIFIYTQGRVVYANKKCEDLMGYTKEEFYAPTFNFLTLIAPESQKKLNISYAKHKAGQEVEPYEYTLVAKTGKRINAVITSKLIKYEGKTSILGIITDITERKRAEKALKESEERAKAIIVNAPIGIATSGPDKHFLSANEAFCRILGYTEDELRNLTFKDITYPSDLDESMLKMKELEAGTFSSFKQEKRYLKKDGTVMYGKIMVSVMRDQAGKPSLFIAELEDITEQKRAEEEILASEKKYRRLFVELKKAEKQMLEERDRAQNYLDVASVMFLALDTKGCITMLNRKGCAILECEAKDAIGKNWFYTFVPKEHRQNVRGHFRSVLTDKANFLRYYESPVLAKNGDIRLIGWHNTVLRDGNGRTLGTLSSGEDITEWKQTQQALVDSEEKFRAISTSAIDAIILLDDTGKITYWNPAAEKIFGYTAEEAIGKKLDNLLITKQSRRHGQHSKSAIRAFVNRQNHRDSIELKTFRKNGTEVFFELSVAVLKIKGKTQLLGIIRDSSERKKMEKTLREAEKRYHALFDKAPLGILLIDETGTAVEFNEEAHRQLGYSGEEFAKLNVSDYEVIETPDETRARMNKILREGRDEFETKHRTKNGEIRDVINTVQVIELSGKKLFHLITRDVTEQKKIESELKIEKDKLEAVTENIGAGLGIISKDFRILWANKLLKQINGGECEGKKCYSTFNKLRDVCPDCGVKKVFETGVPLDVHEYSNLDDKGNRFWIELIVTPIKDEKGSITSALELAVNITERKVMQNKLAEYSQKLEKLVEKRTQQLKQTQAKLVKSERLAAIGELAAMVGHDLRNPLTGIKGAAYYLNSKYHGEISNVGKAMLKTIDECIEHSNKIINDLLEYSRELKLELSENNPKALLAQSMSMLKVPKKVKVINETKDHPTVTVDSARMTRVLLNILQNAVDAMPDGGTLTLTSKIVKGNLQISITDTGTGMSKKTMAKLWTPLFTTKAKGMGFGLSICKRIVEAHKGTISVESKIGKGSTFTVTIPLHPKPAEETATMVFSEPALSASAQTPKPA